LASELKAIPEVHQVTIKLLFGLLYQIIQNGKEKHTQTINKHTTHTHTHTHTHIHTQHTQTNTESLNKMGVNNLAIVFRPTLKLPDNLIVLMIEKYSDLSKLMGW